MRFYLYLGVFLFLFVNDLNSQSIKIDSTRRNSLYLEGYAIRHDFSDGFVSLNYERKIGHKKNRLIRIGMYPDKSTLSVPIVFGRILFPKYKHNFEYGFGGVIRFELYEKHLFTDFAGLIIPLMYRYESKKSFFLRAGANIIVSFPILVSPAVSVGYLFKRKEEKVYKDFIQI